MGNGVELKIEHILMFAIVAFLLYHLMVNGVRCSCMHGGDGFNVGGDVECIKVVQGCTWNDFSPKNPPTDCIIEGSGQNASDCTDAGGKWYEINPKKLEEWDTRFIGGWCQCAYENPSYWDPNYSNTIVAGGFQGDGSIGPFCSDLEDKECVTRSKKVLDQYKNKWLSVGGDRVGTPGNPMSCLDDAYEYIQTFGFNGIAFDMEGCLNLNKKSFAAIKDWITTFKPMLESDFKFVYVGGSYIDGYDFSIFTYICPMLYTNEKFYQTSGAATTIRNILDSWTDKKKGNIPKSKIILTFQTQSAAGGDEPRSDENIFTGNYFLRSFEMSRDTVQLVDKLNSGYAGLLGWPPVYDEGGPGKIQSKADADLCLRLISRTLQRQPKPTPTPAPKPKPQCATEGNSCSWGGPVFCCPNKGLQCKIEIPGSMSAVCKAN